MIQDLRIDRTIQTVDDNINILGSNRIFLTKEPSYEIPQANATANEFAYYGAHLVPVGSVVQFPVDRVIPLTVMSIGKRYVHDYLLDRDLGGGFYIEHHNCQHYHQPVTTIANEEGAPPQCTTTTSGWLILGKFINDSNHVEMSAFAIPHGYGVYLPSNILHCDAFLRGPHLVAYSPDPSYRTGLLRTASSGRVTEMAVKIEDQTAEGEAKDNSPSHDSSVVRRGRVLGEVNTGADYADRSTSIRLMYPPESASFKPAAPPNSKTEEHNTCCTIF